MMGAALAIETMRPFHAPKPTIARVRGLTPPDIRDRLYEAVLTLAALPDRERKWVYGRGTWWPDVLRSEMEKFAKAVENVGEGRAAYDPLREPPHIPTKEAIDRLDETLRWFTLLDKRERDIVKLRAKKISWIRIAWRFGRSDTTVQRWHDAAIDRVWAIVSG